MRVGRCCEDADPTAVEARGARLISLAPEDEPMVNPAASIEEHLHEMRDLFALMAATRNFDKDDFDPAAVFRGIARLGERGHAIASLIIEHAPGDVMNWSVEDVEPRIDRNRAKQRARQRRGAGDS